MPVTEPPEAPEQQTPPRGGGVRPDIATLAGILLAAAGIVGGLILEKGSVQDILQATAALIVFGGTFGAVLVTNPLPVVLAGCKALRDVFIERTPSFEAAIEEIIGYAAKARKNGIVSLEREAERVTDPFLRKALNLAVDGTDLQELRSMMELEMAFAEQKYEAEAKVWESAGGYAPTVGIIGAVMGLIQVMKRLDDIKEVGHGIAVAFVATIYGVGAANIFLLPAANKLRSRAARALLLKELMLTGVVGIVEGLNPKLIRTKLEAYCGGKTQPAQPEEASKAKPKRGAVAA